MDHGKAVEMMAAERYLLDELTPEERDAFEQHVFDCLECALDLRAGAAFVKEAKAQLAEIGSQPARSPRPETASSVRASKKSWSFFWQPAFAVPVFAAMLAIIAYQNASTIPSLRRTAMEPKILHSNAIHAGTRGSPHTTVQADHTEGLALAIELPQSSNYSSYSFELDDPSGKQVWQRNLNPIAGEDNVASLVIPGAAMSQHSYSLIIFGITPQSDRVEIDRRVLDVQFDN